MSGNLALESHAPAYLSVHDIHAYYGESYIVQGVSFTVHEGEILALPVEQWIQFVEAAPSAFHRMLPTTLRKQEADVTRLHESPHVSFDGHNSLKTSSMRIVVIACLYHRERFDQAPSHAGSGTRKRGLT